MKRKVDFTVKGTKLPVILAGTLYDLENDEDGYTNTYRDIKNMVSFGIASECEIFAESPDYTGGNKYIFHLSTIEALAEEQGILWVDYEVRDWDGVRFRYSGLKDIFTLVKNSRGNYTWGTGIDYVSVDYVIGQFYGGIWIEVKDEAQLTPLLSPEKDNGKGGRFIPHPPTTLQPSIEQLLIDCITLNNTIKTSCRLFESIDDSHKLDLMKDARLKLASKVAELNNILNPLPMQSVVEIAEDVIK